MIRKETSNLLADSISKILNVAPASIDPECSDDCTPKITEGSVQDEEEQIELSKPRKQYLDLQDEIGSRYAGKKGSRKSLGESDEEWIESDNIQSEKCDSPSSSFSDSEENESLTHDVEDEEEDDEDAEEDDEDEEEDDEDEEEDDEDEEEDDEDSENNTNDNLNSNILDDPSIKQMNQLDANTQLQKATCVRNQLNIWDDLLEVRIQLQKCLISANKMPQNNVFGEIMQQSPQELQKESTETQKNIENVLSKLLNLQLLLRNNYPETNKLDKTKEIETEQPISNEVDRNIKKRARVQENPEIPTSNESNQVNRENGEIPCKKLKLSNYETQIARNFSTYMSYRNSVIQKWDDKTRLAFVRNNNNSTHTVVDQIKHLLNDKQKMIKRTQTKRSNYGVIGKKLSSDGVDDKNNIDTDPEILDDNDFYHQMLKEFIETKSVDVTDPIKLGKQWVCLQNMRNEMKRKIDTKATKGRKIRYTVHSKLVNFMAPIDYNLSTAESHRELYNSLFGKGQNSNKSCK